MRRGSMPSGNDGMRTVVTHRASPHRSLPCCRDPPSLRSTLWTTDFGQVEQAAKDPNTSPNRRHRCAGPPTGNGRSARPVRPSRLSKPVAHRTPGGYCTYAPCNVDQVHKIRTLLIGRVRHRHHRNAVALPRQRQHPPDHHLPRHGGVFADHPDRDHRYRHPRTQPTPSELLRTVVPGIKPRRR